MNRTFVGSDALIRSNRGPFAGGSGSDPLLSVDNVGRQINAHWLWRNLSFTLHPAQHVGLVGPSGSGKTLLLRALAGLEPLQEGHVTFKGQPLMEWFMPAYRSQVMYLPQRPALSDGTVEAVLREPYSLRIHQGRTFDRKQALQYLEKLGRHEAFLAQRTSELSGGEAQIVAFVRAFLLDPAILLLDESTASLDEATARQLESLVTSWNNRQRACIWTSHNQAQLERVTEHSIVLGGNR